MNSIEELQNIINLMQEALKFYANENNYKGHPSASTCGTPTSLVEMDEGSQARFALTKVKELSDINQKMQEDYDKFMAGYGELRLVEETDPEKLTVIFKEFNNDKNV